LLVVKISRTPFMAVATNSDPIIAVRNWRCQRVFEVDVKRQDAKSRIEG
jgi:hypothetical protein